jgi:DNA invertase Pin-like site-specific DNA recombinase
MNKINAGHLARQACVYIRQSTPGQVQNNLESKRGQYALAERAKQLGWAEIEIIDDDLGRSGTGTHRPGFERLLGSLCDGKVGAVFSIEASRLARNGRDWHTLLEFCSVAGVLLIDAHSVYDPTQIDDRMMLGMKGTISEMEVATFRQRAQAALEQKAKRGELFRRVAIGYARTADDRIEKDPDARVRAAIDLIFGKFVELASARQVYFWLCEQQIKLPAITGAGSAQQVVWNPPRYHSLLSLLQNPIYAGAYAYGRSKAKVRIDQGRKHVVRIKKKSREEWAVLIPDHHEAYISWGAYESNQEMIAHNANGKGELVRGSVKRGGALLSGLLRCGHCGAKLLAQYPGPAVIRYQCAGYVLDREASCCVSFGGLHADRLIAEQVLASLKPLGMQAAIQAIENMHGDNDERVHYKQLALHQARYEVAHARRQYDSVDPSHRLVATELERRWNEALKLQAQLEEELGALEREKPTALSDAIKAELLVLADDLPRLWDHPNSPHEFKKRILRTVLKQIIASSDGDTVRLVLHWQGGDHTEITLQKTRTGMHRYVTDTETVELIRTLARIQPDSMIASILNRIGRRTAHDQSWNARRVCSIRSNHAIEVYREGERQARGELTVSEVASMFGVTETTILRMIRFKQLPATHACVNAPWILLKEDVAKFILASRQEDRRKTRNQNQIELDIQ